MSIARTGGFTGSVSVGFASNFLGLSLSGGTIAAGATSTVIKVTASSSAAQGTSDVTVVGTASGVPSSSVTWHVAVQELYARELFWFYTTTSGLTLTVTVDGTTLGPFYPYYQSSGPYYPANQCANISEPSTYMTNTFQGTTTYIGAWFRVLPNKQYSYTARFSNGTTRTGTFTSYNAGYCGTFKVQ